MGSDELWQFCVRLGDLYWYSKKFNVFQSLTVGEMVRGWTTVGEVGDAGLGHVIDKEGQREIANKVPIVSLQLLQFPSPEEGLVLSIVCFFKNVVKKQGQSEI